MLLRSSQEALAGCGYERGRGGCDLALDAREASTARVFERKASRPSSELGLGSGLERRGGALRMHARERQRAPCGVAAIATGARGLVAAVDSNATECVLR